MGVTKEQLFSAVRKIKNYIDLTTLGTDDILSKDNIIEYTPTSDYHPATKKYVDDSINNTKVSISQKENNAITQEEDGIYVPTIADAKISEAEGNAIIQKEDGLYAPSEHVYTDEEIQQAIIDSVEILNKKT